MRSCKVLFLILLSVSLAGVLLARPGKAQQVIQRGSGGQPFQVLDETEQWSAPTMVASDHDVETYVPDVSSSAWLKRNYREFIDRHQYVVTMFTHYRTMKACRANQVAWGLGDAAHLNACLDIGYRIRQATVDTHLKTVTLIMAAMVSRDGQMDPSSMQHEPISRTWAQLDANTQQALEKTTDMVSREMKIYDRRVQNSQ